MKIIKNLVAIIVLGSMFSCGNQKADVKSLETEIDSASYALGLNVATYANKTFEDINKDLFLQGFKNGTDSLNLLIEDKEVNKILTVFFKKKNEEKRKKDLEKYEVYKQEGIAFLEENKTKEGVKTTESGLQYIVLKEGTGKNPEATSNIKIHYHGMLLDGTVFDSSVEKKKPYDSTANQFIRGFNEGLLLMNEGAKYKFFIPQELAYGASPRPGIIKPYMAIVFEVELLEIKK